MCIMWNRKPSIPERGMREGLLEIMKGKRDERDV